MKKQLQKKTQNIQQKQKKKKITPNKQITQTFQHKPLLTLRGPHGLPMLPAPAQRVEIRRHDVTPEVGTAVVLVPLVA